ncbi:putative acetyltransferase [Ceratocystis lukuohia]
MQRNIDHTENCRRMVAGEMYYSFTPEMLASRSRCAKACKRYNTAGDTNRRGRVMMLNDIMQNNKELPPVAATPEEDDDLFENFPWAEPLLIMDHGWNVTLGDNVLLNFNTVFLDTCPITIGANTLVGPSCSFYTASHPLDPVERNGTKGMENGAPIVIGEDCWFGGNCIVLPGVTIGRGVTVGAGSVVTKDVPDMVVVAGNPARIVRRLEPKDGTGATSDGNKA